MARRLTLASKRKLVTTAVRSEAANLLDLGAGTGAFAAYMQQYGWNVTALEPDPSARQKGLELNKIQLQPVDTLFQLPAETFHVITMWHVLEHVHRLHDYLGQLKKLLSKDGALFIAVPNYTSYDAKHYQEYWAAYDVPRHLYHFSPTSMRLLLQKHGLVVKKTIPMVLDSFYVSMLSEKYKTGKVSLIKGVWYGSISNANAFFRKERCSSLIYLVTQP
jgi:cyclopropane fatty-acyl-phospholipid synthase-like methyltransferase